MPLFEPTSVSFCYTLSPEQNRESQALLAPPRSTANSKQISGTSSTGDRAFSQLLETILRCLLVAPRAMRAWTYAFATPWQPPQQRANAPMAWATLPARDSLCCTR